MKKEFETENLKNCTFKPKVNNYDVEEIISGSVVVAGLEK
jgi:hypothetical protein